MILKDRDDAVSGDDLRKIKDGLKVGRKALEFFGVDPAIVGVLKDIEDNADRPITNAFKAIYEDVVQLIRAETEGMPNHAQEARDRLTEKIGTGAENLANRADKRLFDKVASQISDALQGSRSEGIWNYHDIQDGLDAALSDWDENRDL